jgi:hypothetical protein
MSGEEGAAVKGLVYAWHMQGEKLTIVLGA